jgi:NADH-quinone oxidoreductase subunit M
MLYMFNHGISTAALFLVAGYLIRRRGSRLIPDYGGVEKVAPVLAGIFLVAGLSSLSLPGLGPFVSEFLVLVGAFANAWWWGTAAVLAIVLAALYILLMYQRLMTGPTRPEVVGMSDLNVREVAAMAPLLVLLVVLGFFPRPLTAIINPAVADTLQQVGVHDPSPALPTQAGAAAKETDQ